MVIYDFPNTIDDFETLINLPENSGRHFEFIAGEVVEKMVSHPLASLIAANFVFFIKLHVRESSIKGKVTGADGGYVIGEDRYIPDVAFISSARQEALVDAAYNPLYPDLAVEVISPTDRQRDITIKLSNYLAAGTVIWMVYPDEKIIQVHVSGQKVREFRSGDTLEGGDVLPGFSVEVDQLFAV